MSKCLNLFKGNRKPLNLGMCNKVICAFKNDHFDCIKMVGSRLGVETEVRKLF